MARLGTGWNCAKVPQYQLPVGWTASVLLLSGKATRHDSDFKERLKKTLKEKWTLPDLC